MDNEFCVSVLERALRCHGTPYIFNTDQGSQYTSHEFTKILKDKEIKISMDREGRLVWIRMRSAPEKDSDCNEAIQGF